MTTLGVLREPSSRASTAAVEHLRPGLRLGGLSVERRGDASLFGELHAVEPLASAPWSTSRQVPRCSR